MTSGVIWDLGNVLIDWQPVRAIATGVGDEEARRFLAADDFDFTAFNHGPDSGGSWADAEDEVRRTHPHWAEHALAYRAHFVDSLAGEVPGSVDLVRELHATGVPQWGLTNWSHELWPHAPRLFSFLDELLDGVVVSGTEGVAKPDPRIYALVAERAGLPASRLVFFDDKQVNVDGAAAAGLDAVLFTGAEEAREELVTRGLLSQTVPTARRSVSPPPGPPE